MNSTLYLEVVRIGRIPVDEQEYERELLNEHEHEQDLSYPLIVHNDYNAFKLFYSNSSIFI